MQSAMSPPGMFDRSACSATTRSVADARPPMRIGGWGRWTGLGLPNAPVSRTKVPSTSDGAVSVHSRSITAQASARAPTDSAKSW